MPKVTWKPGTMLYPLPPVMVSCGTPAKPNIITVAWTGITCTEPAMTYISLRPERFFYNIIKTSGEFVINLTTEFLAWAADFCGVKSGRDTDKFKIAHLTPERASQLDCPMIAESPFSIECRVENIMHLGTHDMFLSKIVALNADERYLDSNGVLHLEKAGLVAVSHGRYFTLGREVGTFGYSVRKKKVCKGSKKRL